MGDWHRFRTTHIWEDGIGWVPGSRKIGTVYTTVQPGGKPVRVHSDMGCQGIQGASRVWSLTLFWHPEAGQYVIRGRDCRRNKAVWCQRCHQ